MTASATGARFSYSGNGSSTAFSFPRLFFADTDLKVYTVDSNGVVTPKTLATHYSISGAGSLSGGVVNFFAAPAVGITVVIYRDTPATQGLDLDNVTAWPMTSVEAAFDRAMLLINEVKEQLARTIFAPLTRLGSFDYTLPEPVADKVLGVKSDASGFAFIDAGSGGGGAGTTNWGAIGGTLADQTDLQSALDGKQAANAMLSSLAALVDPNANRIAFWNDSTNQLAWLTVGTNLSISGTTLNASGGAGSADWGSIGGSISAQTDLQSALSGKANTTHSHVINDTTGLQTALDAKSNTGHGHAQSDITGLTTDLAGKASTSSVALKLDASAVSAFGLTLIDDADAATARTTLGLKTGAMVNISVGTSAPGSPATGDLWVDTN